MTYSDAQQAIQILKNGNTLSSPYPDFGGILLTYSQDNSKVIFERKYWSNGEAQYEHREMSESEFEAYISALYTSWEEFTAAFGV